MYRYFAGDANEADFSVVASNAFVDFLVYERGCGKATRLETSVILALKSTQMQ